MMLPYNSMGMKSMLPITTTALTQQLIFNQFHFLWKSRYQKFCRS